MKTNENNNLINILVQGFYGNLTTTTIDKENFDAFMLGNLDGRITKRDKIDRSYVRVPDTANLVIIYNKYQEEASLSELQRFIQELRQTKSRFNPTAVIPESGTVLYSRCIVCRMDEFGNLLSMESEDYEKVLPYLAR